MYYKILDKFLSDVSHDPASARIFSILADKDIFILDYRISINKYFGITEYLLIILQILAMLKFGEDINRVTFEGQEGYQNS